MTQQEIDMVRRAIETHMSALMRDADAYSKNGNTEAAMDCFSEVRKYKELKQRLAE